MDRNIYTKEVIVIIKIINKLIKEEKGQGLVEYALILVCVTIVVIVMLTSVGKKNLDTINKIATGFPPESS